MELIQHNAGLSNVDSAKLEKWTICPKHRYYSLGIDRNFSKQCRESHKKPKDGRSPLDVTQAILYQHLFVKNVRIGDKLCRTCLQEFRHAKQERSKEVDVWLKEIETHRRESRIKAVSEELEEQLNTVEAAPVAGAYEAAEETLEAGNRQAKVEALQKLQVHREGEDSLPSSQNLPLSQSSGSSYAPSPEKGVQSSVTEFNRIIGEASKRTGKPFEPLRFQLKIPFSEAAGRTQREARRSLQQATAILAESINPGSSSELLAATFGARENVEASISDATKESLGALIEAFHQAPSPREQLFVLAMAAGAKTTDTETESASYLYTISQLQQFFSTSQYRVSAARKYVRDFGVGRFAPKEKIPRVRLDMAAAEDFIDFVYNRGYIRLVSWGKSVIKYDSGATETIGGLVQTTIASHIIHEYQNYCAKRREAGSESGEDQVKPLSERTCYRLINDVFTAKRTKALAGLDNIAAAGSAAFSKLRETIGLLLSAGVDKDSINDLGKKLELSKAYITWAFLEHVSEPEGSRCPCHCFKLGLSDPSDERLVENCDHEHDQGCESCEQIVDTFEEIRRLIESTEKITNEEKADCLYDLETSVVDVFKWKAHVLRSKHQDKARFSAVNLSDEKTGLIIYDWAMKIEPKKFREPQKDWFGKRGMSLFGCALLLKNSVSGKVEKYSYHVFLQSCNQDGRSSMAVLDYVLKQIKKDFPQLEAAFEKCDNAGALHSYESLLYKMQSGETTGIQVLRSDYNDPGAGKDQCDRDFAAIKEKLKVMLNGGYDLENVQQIMTALKSAPVQIKGMKYAVVELNDETSEKPFKEKLKQKFPFAITKFHSFKFDPSISSLTAWRYFEIGKGVQCIDISDMSVSLPEVAIVTDFLQQQVVPGQIKAQTVPKDIDVQDQIEQMVLPCSKPGCKFLFGSEEELESHELLEQHSYELTAETAMDQLRRLFVERAKGQVKQSAVQLFLSHKPVKHPVQQGHALPTKPPSRAHSRKAVQFLKQLFEAGLTSRQQRTTGESAAKQLRSALVEGTNLKMFQPGEYLTPAQCTSFFSTKFAELKKGKYKCISKKAAEVIKSTLGYEVVMEDGNALEEKETREVVHAQELDQDFRLAEAVAERQDTMEEVTCTDGMLGIGANEWVAYLVPENHWAIGKVRCCDATSGIVHLRPMQVQVDSQHFKWVRGVESVTIEESKVLSVIDEPVRVAKGKQSFTVSEEDWSTIEQLANSNKETEQNLDSGCKDFTDPGKRRHFDDDRDPDTAAGKKRM